MKRKCLYCGSVFERPGRSQKYCSQRCYHRDSRLTAEQSGINVRKRIMAMGVHGDDSLAIVTRKLLHYKAPYREKIVILDDMLRERSAVRAQIRERFKAIGKKRKDTLRALLRELEKQARKEWRYT